MNGLLPMLAFVLGCVMLVLGVTGLSHVRSRKARRRNLVIFSLDEFFGYGMEAARRRESHIEIASRMLVVFGAVMALVGYLRL